MKGGIDHNGTEYEKTFFVPRYFKTASSVVRPICQAHGYDAASLDTLEEFEAVSLLCKRHQNLINNDYVHIDGITMTPKSQKDWYWTVSGKKVNYEMSWAPKNLDFNYNSEWCLSLGPANVYQFNDIRCQDQNLSFICQRTQNWCSDPKESL